MSCLLIVAFLQELNAAHFPLQALSYHDILRAAEIMDSYASAKLDFVDCALMALSERLNITQICTYDRRDFSIFRPTHCDFLELKP